MVSANVKHRCAYFSPQCIVKPRRLVSAYARTMKRWNYIKYSRCENISSLIGARLERKGKHGLSIRLHMAPVFFWICRPACYIGLSATELLARRLFICLRPEYCSRFAVVLSYATVCCTLARFNEHVLFVGAFTSTSHCDWVSGGNWGWNYVAHPRLQPHAQICDSKCWNWRIQQSTGQKQLEIVKVPQNFIIF